MKEQQRLLQEIALMLEHQDMLSKLTESQCLDEYGYSETHCIDNIGRLELPNVTKISKMTKKLLAKGLIEKYTLETNKKEVYFKLTERGKVLFKEHEKRHKQWEKRDMQFLSRYSKEETDTILKFMQEFNVYLDEQIEQYITDSRESTESR